MARRAPQRILTAALLALAAGSAVIASEPAPAVREAAHTALASLVSGKSRVAALLGASRYAAPLARSTVSISQ